MAEAMRILSLCIQRLGPRMQAMEMHCENMSIIFATRPLLMQQYHYLVHRYCLRTVS